MGEMPCCGLSPHHWPTIHRRHLDEQRLVREPAEKTYWVRANGRHDDRTAGGIVRTDQCSLPVSDRRRGARSAGPEEVAVCPDLDNRGRRVTCWRRRRSPDFGTIVLVDATACAPSPPAKQMSFFRRSVDGWRSPSRFSCGIPSADFLPTMSPESALKQMRSPRPRACKACRHRQSRAARTGRVRHRVFHRIVVMPLLLAVFSSRHCTRSVP